MCVDFTDTLRVANQPPDFRGLSDDIWGSGAAVCGRFGVFLGVQPGIKNMLFDRLQRAATQGFSMGRDAADTGRGGSEQPLCLQVGLRVRVADQGGRPLR